MTIVQLTDLHIGAPDGDPSADLRAALSVLAALRGDAQPAAVLVTGDLVNDGHAEQYEQAAELLSHLDVPLYVLPGNHDDRAGLRAAFPLGDLDEGDGDPAAPYRYAVDGGDVRLVACDTVTPGSDDGAFADEQLRWLDATLAAQPDVPTLVAMHHPPMLVGLPVLDPMALPAASREALGTLLAAHPQVHRVACGHVHLAAAGAAGKVPVLSAPSTWRVQFRLDLGVSALRIFDGPGGLVVHTLVEGDIVSHVRTVDAL